MKTIYLAYHDYDTDSKPIAFESEKDCIKFCKKHKCWGWSEIKLHLSNS